MSIFRLGIRLHENKISFTGYRNTHECFLFLVGYIWEASSWQRVLAVFPFAFLIKPTCSVLLSISTSVPLSISFKITAFTVVTLLWHRIKPDLAALWVKPPCWRRPNLQLRQHSYIETNVGPFSKTACDSFTAMSIVICI